jgi:hypothetical protein
MTHMGKKNDDDRTAKDRGKEDAEARNLAKHLKAWRDDIDSEPLNEKSMEEDH